MQKKLLAVAVAGLLGAPAVALAQSSVTISGVFKISWDNVSIRQPIATRFGNTSESRIADDSSRIIFNVTEDLGGGLAAIGQIDLRFTPDNGTVANSGNSHVGLRSKTWGRLIVGRQDVHYFNTESTMTTKAASLKSDSVSILAFANGGQRAIAGATRTPNIIHYTSPNWGPFTIIAAYSTAAGAVGAESDIGSGVRRGNAWHLNPNFAGANWQVGYSYWNQKSDGVTTTPATVTTGSVNTFATAAAAAASSASCAAAFAAAAVPANGVVCIPGTAAQTALYENQRGDRLYGSYTWGGFKLGLAWDRSKVWAGTGTVAANVNTLVSNRTAWSIPVAYSWGNHNLYAHYDKARNDRAAGFAGLDSQAKMWAFAYVYDLSKRTSVGLTYAQITNGAAANYQLFTSNSLGSGTSGTAAYGGVPAAVTTGAGVNPGEDPRIFAATLRHAF